MGMSVTVDDAKRIRGTGRQQEIVAADGVLGDTQENPASVGVKGIAGGEEDSARVVDRAP
jgi:hypothetical protein